MGDRRRFLKLATSLGAGLAAPTLSKAVADIPPTGKPIKLFNGKNLKHFDTFLRDKGFNNDPEHVFHVKDGAVVVSGKEYGYFITKQEYSDYYLRLEFKWGNPTYPPCEGKAHDAGILYHVVGENKTWPKSLEFQMIEAATGSWSVAVP